VAETTFEQRDRLALRDWLLDVFLTAARERNQRQVYCSELAVGLVPR
jgi:hypothetical protein